MRHSLIYLLCVLPLGAWAQAEADSTVEIAFPFTAQLGEHSFSVTRNEFVGKIHPTAQRPYETTVYIAVGENKKQAYLAITASNVWENELIDGDISITMGNGQVITCHKRKLYNNSLQNGEQVAMGLYFLSFSQLKKIAQQGITSVYFPLLDARTDTILPCDFRQAQVRFQP